MNPIFHDTFPTAFGLFSVGVDAAGAVVGAAFGDAAALRLRVDGGQCANHQSAAAASAAPASATGCGDQRPAAGLAAARRQIETFLQGERTGFDLPLAPMGTAFQQRVWLAVRRIPLGETRSYGQLAAELRSSPRAVGRANATNPICLLIPCHRVIGAGGALTGCAFGLERKQRLLALERRA